MWLWNVFMVFQIMYAMVVGIVQDCFADNYLANDRRRPVVATTVLWVQRCAPGLLLVLASLTVGALFLVAAISVAPPPVKDFVACLDEPPSAMLNATVLEAAKEHGYWCSTIAVREPQPCVCCLYDGTCFARVTVKAVTNATANVTEVLLDGRTQTREVPAAVIACYDDVCREVVGPDVAVVTRCANAVKND